MQIIKIVTIAWVCLGFVAPGFAQKIVRMDPYETKYEQGVVLVKFEENVEMSINKEGRLGKIALTNIQKTLTKYSIEKGETLFPQAKRGERLGKVRSFSGEEREAKSLHNIFRFHFDTTHDAKAVAEDLSRLSGVIYAEPDYIFSALDTIPNDPLCGQQWYLPVINAPAAWDTTKGDTTQIIGIIDTGVDWDHPDLAEKIKINWAEYNGIAGLDDDGNGYVDDIRGWDFINDDNNPNDDNSHGTHVAGIAAAETNNSIGIAGVSWNAKILPVKVLQSTGYGSSSIVAQGVEYARRCGATVINMSLGSYSESLTLKTALENAYTTAVLIAAAGNDDISIDGMFGKPMFPACYGWVIGVEATKQTWDNKYGWRASFSNYDPSGPVACDNSNGYNYELKAPGVSVFSTLPNGQHGILSGTSMAAPIVSGAVALLKCQKPSISQELLLGNLINGLGNTLDIYAAMNQTPAPDLRYISYTLVDTLSGCDRDGRPDAGETVQLWLTVENVWGHADSVWSKLRLAPLEDPGVATITDSTSFIINGLSAYATATGESNPFQIQLASGLVNNRQFVFNYEIGCKNSGRQAIGNIVLTIQKGKEVGGIITSNTVWTNDKFYIVTSNISVPIGRKLTIQPGTEIRFSNGTYLVVDGTIEAKGNADSLIIFTKNSEPCWDGIWLRGTGNNNSIFEYCIIEYIPSITPGAKFAGLRIENCSPRVQNSIIRYSGGGNGGAGIQINGGSPVIKYNYMLNNSWSGIYSTSGSPTIIGNNVLFSERYGGLGTGIIIETSTTPFVHHNNILLNEDYSMLSHGSYSTEIDVSNNWFGLSDSSLIGNLIYDYTDDFNRALLKWWPYLHQPSDSAHGIIWKVLVNGKNPQEETLDPIGTETSRFDVYFNRAMDIAFPPTVTFGVREPYTQHVVEDSAYWSADSTIWHGYFTVGLETGDGINTIRVSGAKDTDHFEIPIENRRFKFTIDAAGSAANEFTAETGVGKVILNWPKAPTEDVLGYNMYRYTNLTDSTYSSTERINTTLITDTTYVDFAVVPNTTYHYLYKVLGTDMAESDYSKAIVATPVSASSGDANGDLTVNVLDIISIVSHILNKNPQPFILEAADVNHDNIVNVLDVVGTINIILQGGGGGMNKIASMQGGESAILRAEKGLVSLEIPSAIGGLQLTVTGSNINEELERVQTPKGFEIVRGKVGKDTIVVMLYSLSGKAMEAGKYELLRAKDIGIKIVGAVVSDVSGGEIQVKVNNDGESIIPENFELQQNYPNPFNAATTIRYGLPLNADDVEITIYDVLGRKVRTLTQERVIAGFHQVVWDGKGERGVTVASGVYFYRLKVRMDKTTRLIATNKMLLIK